MCAAFIFMAFVIVRVKWIAHIVFCSRALIFRIFHAMASTHNRLRCIFLVRTFLLHFLFDCSPFFCSTAVSMEISMDVRQNIFNGGQLIRFDHWTINSIPFANCWLFRWKKMKINNLKEKFSAKFCIQTHWRWKMAHEYTATTHILSQSHSFRYRISPILHTDTPTFSRLSADKSHRKEGSVWNILMEKLSVYRYLILTQNASQMTTTTTTTKAQTLAHFRPTTKHRNYRTLLFYWFQCEETFVYELVEELTIICAALLHANILNEYCKRTEFISSLTIL